MLLSLFSRFLFDSTKLNCFFQVLFNLKLGISNYYWKWWSINLFDSLIQKEKKFGQKETHWTWFIRVELSIVLHALHRCDSRSDRVGFHCKFWGKPQKLRENFFFHLASYCASSVILTLPRLDLLVQIIWYIFD